MKKKLSLFIIHLLLITVDCYSQNSEILTFEGKVNLQVVNSPNVIGSENKQLHLRSSKSAQITPVYNENQMKHFHPLANQIIRQAIGKWEKKIYIPAGKNINISFILDNTLDSSLAYIVNVKFNEYDGILYPLPMAIANYGYTQLAEDELEIRLNSDSSMWFFEGDADNPVIDTNQYDFETGVLRALAHCFGFGSSIYKRRPALRERFNIFDQFIVNSNNDKLINLNESDANAISSYVTGDNVYWKSGSTSYALYSRNPYDQDKSLKYFDSNLENELMSVDFKKQIGNRNIDSKVTKIMEDIGWKTLLETPLTIKSNNINNITGIGNVSNSYLFYYESLYTVENPSWKYMVRKKDNTYETIKSGASTTFSIDPLTIKDNYHRNENGDFCSKIVLTASVNNQTVTSEFNVWLEAKPANIEYDVKVIKESDWYYNIEVAVSSAGAKDLIIKFNDYSIGQQLVGIHYDKQFTKYTYKYLYYDSPILIEFSARNSYGITNNSYYTSGISYYNHYLKSKVHNQDIKDGKDLISKEVFSILTGKYETKLETGQSIESANIPSGYYIVKTTYSDGTLTSEKVYKKP